MKGKGGGWVDVLILRNFFVGKGLEISVKKSFNLLRFLFLFS